MDWMGMSKTIVGKIEFAPDYKSAATHAVDALALAQREKLQWRPIASAPEHTALLLYWPAYPNDDESVGPRISIGGSKAALCVHGEGIDLFTPTHWMPLPEAPA